MTQTDRDRLVTLKKAKKKLITQREAAEELGLSIRQVKRLLYALKKRGDKAVIHGLHGRPSNQRIEEAVEREAVTILSAVVYRGFRPTLAAEYLGKKHGIEASKETAAVWFGGMAACRNLVVVTVSEGIGTGVLVNGQLVRGLNGMAGEFGHVQLDPNGPLCGCGGRGCWEVFASDDAALRYYLEAVHESKSDGLTFAGLLSRADQGDAQAAKALNTMAGYLARGMQILVAGLAPESIVVVGDLAGYWRHFGALIDAGIAAHLLPGACPPRVVPANEGGMARLRGTVALVLQNDFGMSREVWAF